MPAKTPQRLTEEQDFINRMRDGQEAQKAADAFRKAELKRFNGEKRNRAHQDHRGDRRQRTPKHIIGRAFKAGSGKLS
jgi:hypothetical protein